MINTETNSDTTLTVQLLEPVGNPKKSKVNAQVFNGQRQPWLSLEPHEDILTETQRREKEQDNIANKTQKVCQPFWKKEMEACKKTEIQ